MLGHESQLLTGTLCAVFHCWEWKKLSMKWKKGSQPAESHHSSSRRGPAAEGLPWVSALLTSAKLPASSRKKPRCRKSPLQPQNSLSACAESELPTAGAVGTHLSHATGRGQPQRAAGKPCVPGMRLKPEPAASFTLCIFSFRHAGIDFFFFFLQLRRRSFNPTQNMQL